MKKLTRTIVIAMLVALVSLMSIAIGYSAGMVKATNQAEQKMDIVEAVSYISDEDMGSLRPLMYDTAAIERANANINGDSNCQVFLLALAKEDEAFAGRLIAWVESNKLPAAEE